MLHTVVVIYIHFFYCEFHIGSSQCDHYLHCFQRCANLAVVGGAILHGLGSGCCGLVWPAAVWTSGSLWKSKCSLVCNTLAPLSLAGQHRTEMVGGKAVMWSQLSTWLFVFFFFLSSGIPLVSDCTASPFQGTSLIIAYAACPLYLTSCTHLQLSPPVIGK